MNNLDELLEAVRACSDEQKQALFEEIRGSVLIHKLEQSLNVRADIILEAIHRSPDLTQRGVRGLLAEAIFIRDVLPLAEGWTAGQVIGDLAYDAVLQQKQSIVRVQVKMQRSEAGRPKRRGDNYVVEVQRTRTGVKDGVSTRPYRFGDFDLLAVCMRASTKSWQSFMYAAANNLVRSSSDANIIQTMQNVSPHPEDATATEDHTLPLSLSGEAGGIWTSDLNYALERFLPIENS